MSTFAKRPLSLIALVAVAGSALAAPPTTSFLTPSKYAGTVGESLAVRFDAGAAKDAQPAAWPVEGVPWLFVRSGPTQENRHDVRPQRASDNSAAIDLAHPGVTLVGVNRAPVVLDMTARELRAFLDQNAAGLSSARPPATDAKLRVRHIASGNTLIRVQTPDGGNGPSATAASKSGQATQIMPLVDLTLARVGSDIPVRVFVDGDRKVAGKVQATHVATGQTQSFLTDAVGSGHFSLTDAGLWRVEFHHAEPLENDPAADWVLYSATLTFEVQKGAGQ